MAASASAGVETVTGAAVAGFGVAPGSWDDGGSHADDGAGVDADVGAGVGVDAGAGVEGVKSRLTLTRLPSRKLCSPTAFTVVQARGLVKVARQPAPGRTGVGFFGDAQREGKITR